MSTLLEDNFADVWERTIQPADQELTPDAARYFLNLQFSASDRTRMNHLAERARDGLLSESEESELANYMQLGWFLDILKSKARLKLGIQAPPA